MSDNAASQNPTVPAISRPVLATFSILIAAAVALTWVISLIAVWRGVPPAGSGLAILLTVPAGAVGSGIAILALMYRGENKHIVQYGLWTNGLLGFFAFPLMMTVLIGL